MSDVQRVRIHENEIVLDEVFRHTPVGVVLLDLHGNVIDVNVALCRLVGHSRDELLGRSFTDISHPDDVEDVKLRLTDLREGRAGHYVVNRRYLKPGGETVQAKVSASVVYSPEGEPVCGVGFVEDITERAEMDEALRKSELRYRRIVEDQTEMIVRSLPDGTRTFVNEAYCRYSGLPATQLLGTSFFDFINKADHPAIRAKLEALSPENPVITEQHWAIVPGGAMRWHEWTDRGFFDEEGKLIEMQSVGRDLTEQHEAHLELARREERYRRLFNSLPVAAWENDWSLLMAELKRRGLEERGALQDALRKSPLLFYELAQYIRIAGVNAAALEMGGVETPEQFRDWLLRAWTPESARRYGAALPSLIAGDLKYITDEYTLRRSNGQRLDVLFRVSRSERWGEEWMLFPIAVDITERNRVQRQLIQKQELSERAEAAAHFGSWEWNPTGDLIYGSAEFWRLIDGRKDGGAQERPASACFAALHPDDSIGAMKLWRELQEPSAEWRPDLIEREYRLLRPDGSVTDAQGQTFVTFDERGVMTRAFGILRDVTAEKRAAAEASRHRDELVRADKMISLGILVSGMAHEINNPNHSIGLNLPLLRAAWRDASECLDENARHDEALTIGRMPWAEARSEVAAMIDDIEQASERIRNIVTELRAFAIDHDPGELRQVSLNDVVKSAKRLVRKQVFKATRRFEVDLASQPPLVRGNARRLEQVVVNLVMNACQALRSNDQAIRLSTGVSDSRAFVRVHDDGVGIMAEDLAQIRTPFFTTKRAEGGTGLGVPVSDRIAAEHGGELTFESEPGHGTIATLWLPLVGA
jgi:PAS domain S-box-containing protein